MLDKLHQRLLALHAGGIEKDFAPWVSDAVLARVLSEGVVLRPSLRHVLYNVGAPLECHANALAGGKLFGVETLCGVPWFGFRLISGCWWCHSWWIDDGVLIDSCPGLAPRIFWGMPWDVALFRMLFPGDDLPAALWREEEE
jgi:hypothetical protein